MDEIKSSNGCLRYEYTILLPSGVQWMKEMETVYFVFLIISTIFVVITIGLAILHILGVYMYIHNENIQSDMYFLLLLFPVVAVASLIGLYLPRSAELMFVVSLTYLMVCLQVVTTLMRHLYGNRRAIAEHLRSQGILLSFSTPPLCCCCKCLPYAQPTEKNIRLIEWLVLQSPIVRILIQLIMIVLFIENNKFKNLSVVLNTLQTMSMLVATYGGNILVLVGQGKLQEYRFGTIFRFVNLTQVCFTLQKLIFDLIGNYAFSNGPLLQQSSKALYWNGVTLTMEMCLMSIIATYFINPRRSALFALGQTEIHLPHFAQKDENAHETSS